MNTFHIQSHVQSLHDANRLGLNYRHEAARFAKLGPIWDIHTHINGIDAATRYLTVADHFGIEKIYSMTSKIENVDAMREQFGDRIRFIAVPDYTQRDNPDTFNVNWHKRITEYAQRGSTICKFWAAPRGRDLSDDLILDAPSRLKAMHIARDHGMDFMTHVSDPDTWFATHYKDHHRYGTKAQQYEPLERLLDQFHDVRWIAAHMAGSPEDLERIAGLLDRHPNLWIDTSATKWMVRELSKHIEAFADFCRRYVDRILFGSDIVAMPDDEHPYDLYASRYWALRVMLETDYHGASPIVDPDLSLIDPTLPRESTATLSGAQLDTSLLQSIYHDNAVRFFERQ